MSGGARGRVYLDWNATTPLCAPARAAMIEAMERFGNPSSVHQEGRAARAAVERARSQLAAFLGVGRADLVFTASATEAAALAFHGAGLVQGAQIEHDAVHAHLGAARFFGCDGEGRVQPELAPEAGVTHVALQAANSETGVCQDLMALAPKVWAMPERPLLVVDAVQALGKTDLTLDRSGADLALVSAHKFGGPKGVGALYIKPGIALKPLITGGGQEEGRRSGTENLLGIIGMGAAAEAAIEMRGAWAATAELRDWMEAELRQIAPEIVIFGAQARRLPNTSCFAIDGWKGETQVMQMDLAGIAISAGSACSSGKVKSSRVLRAMGACDTRAASAIRISLGPETRKTEIEAFLGAWSAAYHLHSKRMKDKS